MIYGSVQQSFRQGANDPQIQMARDIALSLEGGTPITSLSLPAHIDIAKSLAPFVIIYDENGKSLLSTAELAGETPAPPKGVFEYSKNHGEDRITWQPRDDVRSAMVIKYAGETSKNFVLVGRSLDEVEKREGQLVSHLLFGWVVGLIVILGFFVVGQRFKFD